MFAFVKRNLSGARRRKSATSEERGAGKGRHVLSPPSTQNAGARSALRTSDDLRTPDDRLDGRHLNGYFPIPAFLGVIGNCCLTNCL